MDRVGNAGTVLKGKKRGNGTACQVFCLLKFLNVSPNHPVQGPPARICPPASINTPKPCASGERSWVLRGVPSADLAPRITRPRNTATKMTVPEQFHGKLFWKLEG